VANPSTSDHRQTFHGINTPPPGGARVSLGCGTLIFIAIIVAMFSRSGDESDAIRALQKEIQTLEQKIDNIGVKPEVPAQADPGGNNQ